jgi:hypothetical protein
VIVVDGGSADDTVAVARAARPGVRVIRQTRSGKGNALACGIAVSRGDIVVTMNGDGSTDPGEIPRFVDALLAGADVAHGSRFRFGGEDLSGTRLGRFGNRLLTRMVNRSFGTRFTDVGSGYNAFWRDGVEALGLPAPQTTGRPVWGDGAEIEPLIAIRMAAEGMRVMEVATTRYPRVHGRRPRRGPERMLRAWKVLRAERRRHEAKPPRRVEAGTATGRHAAVAAPAPRRPYPGPRPDWAESVNQVRHTALYDTGITRTGQYDTGVHRIDVYDTGVDDPARDVGGGRRRLGADDRRAEPRTGVRRP